MLKPTLKCMLRRWLSCVLLVLLVCVGAFGMTLLAGVLDAQKAALDKVYDESSIRCVISNLSGTKTDRLEINTMYIDLCTTSYRHDFCSWIERVNLKRTLKCDEEIQLTGISYPEAAVELLPENGAALSFFDGYSEAIFQTDQAVCLVPAAKLSELTVNGDGSRQISVTSEGKTATMTVAGAYYGGISSAVYCPFNYLSKFLAKNEDIYTDSLSFYVKDNRTLEEFKEEAEKYFSEPSITAEDKPMYYAITVYDELFNKTVAGIEENIAVLGLLLPILYIIAAGTGLLASFLYIRGRVREFAVMRSLGLSRIGVTGLVSFEQIIIAAVGTALGVSACFAFFSGVAIKNAVNGLLFTLCYLVGALVAVLWITNVNVLRLLKSDE